MTDKSDKSDKSVKLPFKLNCPIDNIIIYVGSKFYFIYKCLHFTPNTLTTISLILGLLACFYFYKQYFIVAGILYFVSYCYDVLDGNYARKYNMVSNFGDIYDHFKDVFVNIVLFFVFIKYSKLRNKVNLLIFLFLVTAILFMFIIVNLGCKEVYASKNRKDTSNFLSFSRKFCSKKMYNNLKYVRFLGTGLFSLWITFLIILNKLF